MDTKIDAYIGKQKPLQKEVLEKVRQRIQRVAPLAEEAMSYGVPAFRLNGRLLVAYATFTRHLGIYPDPEIIDRYAKELTGYTTSKGAIQLPLDQAIPYDLIEKIVKYKYNRMLDTK